MINFYLTIIYLITTTTGLILMKLGGDSISFNFSRVIGFKIGLTTFFGFIMYIVSFLIWQKLLVTNNLSYIVPITTAIMQVILLMVGLLIFKEKITVYNIIGVMLIVSGVILIALKK